MVTMVPPGALPGMRYLAVAPAIPRGPGADQWQVDLLQAPPLRGARPGTLEALQQPGGVRVHDGYGRRRGRHGPGGP
jgi:hypothetical protein